MLPKETGRNKIDASAIVHPGVVMGRGNIIKAGAVIYEGVRLGDDNIIDEYAIIGSPGEYIGKESSGKVIIGNYNHFGEFCTIHAPVLTGLTQVGNHCFIMTKTHIAHDCMIGDRCVIAPFACLGGLVVLERFCNLGIGVNIHPRVKIAEGCMIGMNATIVKDTHPWRKYIGVGKDIGDNIIGRERCAPYL